MYSIVNPSLLRTAAAELRAKADAQSDPAVVQQLQDLARRCDEKAEGAESASLRAVNLDCPDPLDALEAALEQADPAPHGR